MPISRRQRALNLFARFVQKPTLRWVAHAPTLRVIQDLQGLAMHRRVPGIQVEQGPVAPGLAGLRVSPRNAGPRRLLYFHGGGFITGSPRYVRWLGARLALGMGGAAVLPAYRLAPEHPFPAALDDAVAAYRALLGEAAPNQIAVAGDSAGGWLTVALLGRLRASGLPFPGALGLLSPFVDATMSSESVRAFRDTDLILPVAFGRRGLKAYLGTMPRDDPEASPLFADLSDAPPTLIQAAEGEVLRDDAVRLAARMPQARLTLWEGVPHVWQVNAGWSPEADRAVAEMGAFFDETLRP